MNGHKDDVDGFDILAAWPTSENSITPAAIAYELEVHPNQVTAELNELASTDAVIVVGTNQYDLTGIGAILASQPDGGRSLSHTQS